jgi:hypothetical protein
VIEERTLFDPRRVDELDAAVREFALIPQG